MIITEPQCCSPTGAECRGRSRKTGQAGLAPFRLASTCVGPEAAATYACDLITEFSDYDTTYDGASPGEGAQ